MSCPYCVCHCLDGYPDGFFEEEFKEEFDDDVPNYLNSWDDRIIYTGDDYVVERWYPKSKLDMIYDACTCCKCTDVDFALADIYMLFRE